MAAIFALACSAAALFFAWSARESWRDGVVHSAFVDGLAGTACLAAAVAGLASVL